MHLSRSIAQTSPRSHGLLRRENCFPTRAAFATTRTTRRPSILGTMRASRRPCLSSRTTLWSSNPERRCSTPATATSFSAVSWRGLLELASYERYMHQAIFEPAQMPTTRLDDVFAIMPHRARGYRVSAAGDWQNAVFVDVSNKPPGSGINSSARDMGDFIAALYSAKLVSKSTLDQMLAPATTRDGKPTIYGLGFFRGGPIGRYRELQEAGHGGDQQGVSSLLYLLPEREFGVVILSNLESQQSSLDFIDLSRKIYDVVSSK